MTASDFDHAYGFLLTRGRSPYMRRFSGANRDGAVISCDENDLQASGG